MTEQAYWTRQLIYQLVKMGIIALFLLTPRALLKKIDEKNRTLNPELVWLNLIPVFEYVWILVTLLKIRSSVRAQLLERRMNDHANDSAFSVGLASWLFYLALTPLAVLVLLQDGQNYTLTLFGLAGLTFVGLWIAYWVKLANLKNDLGQFPRAEAVSSAWQAQGRVCSSCGTAAYDGDVFCRVCGATLVSPAASAAPAAPIAAAPAAPVEEVPADEAGADQARCPFCATPYRANARFCSSCGRPAV
jgi:hypothetical protein